MANALESHDLVCSGVDLSLLNPGVRARTHSQERGLITSMAFLPFAGAGTLGIRRRLFQDVGGFDPVLRCYEEADLCWRIQLAGDGPPVFVSEARLHYRLKRGRIKQWWKAVALVKPKRSCMHGTVAPACLETEVGSAGGSRILAR